jgi:hypothetical protein
MHIDPKPVQLDLLENTFKGWIASGIPTATIVCALHNACAHGDVMLAAGEDVTDENLTQLFDGFDLSLEAARSMEV